jgi:hypothetical protein
MAPAMTKFFKLVVSMGVIFQVSITFAIGEEFCSSLTRVANETYKGFKVFRGADDEIGGYTSKFIFPGANECYIDKEDSSFNCSWQLNFSDDSDEQAKAFAEGIRACYSKGAFQFHSSNTGNYYTHRVNGVEFYIKSDPKRNRVRIVIDQDK